MGVNIPQRYFLAWDFDEILGGMKIPPLSHGVLRFEKQSLENYSNPYIQVDMIGAE